MRGQQLTNIHRLFDGLEVRSTTLRIFRSPKFLKRINSTRNLRPRLSKPVLFMPQPRPQVHRVRQTIWSIDRVRLGVFSTAMGVVESLFGEKQLRQGVIDPKQQIVPVGRGSDPEGCLEVLDRLLGLTLGVIYETKEVVRLTDQELIAFV